MQVEIIAQLLDRELASLRQEVELYPDDASLCVELKGLRNPGGNLALHLCGNLQHFVGALLGDSGYVRDRDAEFGRRDLTRAALLKEIDVTRAIVAKTLQRLAPERWAADYPLQFNGATLPTSLFLTHLCVHLGYHLGQLDAHRRATTADPKVATTLSITALRARA